MREEMKGKKKKREKNGISKFEGNGNRGGGASNQSVTDITGQLDFRQTDSWLAHQHQHQH